MEAIVQTGYGTAQVMQFMEVEARAPAEGEVLVRVMAASLGAGDVYGMRGRPLPIRLHVGLPRPRPGFVVGLDFAGVVEAVGAGAHDLRPGDAVYGECRGSCAERAVAKVGSIARLPRNLTFTQAAAVPTSGCTALQALRDHGQVRPGHKVLINGASGGVGPFAVQIAKALGAEVTAVCSTPAVDLVRAIGADHVIDYTLEDFTTLGPRYDVILDNVASHTLAETRRALRPEGRLLPSSGRAGMGWILAAAVSALFVRQQGMPFVATTDAETLLALNGLIEAGKVTPVVDRSYPLREAARAFEYLDAGHARGKVVIAAGAPQS